MDALLTTIVLWLTANFGLPATYDHPKVEIVSPTKMMLARFHGLMSDRGPNVPAAADGVASLHEFSPEIYALYLPHKRIIYLREGWTGTTPGEVSILVHEMVHHLQNVANTRFSCPQEREKNAYRAQMEWLALFGRKLEQDFDIDGFTVLIRTNCAF